MSEYEEVVCIWYVMSRMYANGKTKTFRDPPVR